MTTLRATIEVTAIIIVYCVAQWAVILWLGIVWP